MAASFIASIATCQQGAAVLRSARQALPHEPGPQVQYFSHFIVVQLVVSRSARQLHTIMRN